ncbi:MAG: methyltransferase domain-containing protein [Clostridiales bacterium]|nr:methyltransferase domain-containing protein [Clostridiales bacterium]
MDVKEQVAQQYADDKNLSARMRLYAKHSTNRQPFAAWLWEQYAFFPHCRILELGCGNGSLWEGRRLPDNCYITLTDISEGMLSTAHEKLGHCPAFSFRQADIQALPFPDASFDFVIANHMLYHVSDLSLALSEVRRVLKHGGKFYASTVGNGGLHGYMRDVLQRLAPNTGAFGQNFKFSLQNGAALLGEYFSNVQRRDYADNLSISETQDLMDWLQSTISFADNPDFDYQAFYDYFEGIRKRDGAIHIPQEVGTFLCVSPF